MKERILKKPAKGLAALKQHWRNDLLSGFVVSLIALPLCLGIAMASGVPPMAGIIAGIVGGLLVSFTSGSHLTINGPAAGLAIIVLMSIEGFKAMAPHGMSAKEVEMFAYQSTLGVAFLCGLLQIFFGFVKAGLLSNFFPSSVVHGMMAAIGIMIFSKQLHVALGVKPDATEMLEVILSIPDSIVNMNPEVVIISLASLAILIFLPKSKVEWIRRLPAPLVVVLLAIPMGEFFDLEHEHRYLFLDGHEYSLGPKFLVSLPDNPLDGLVMPIFDNVFTPFGIQMIITFALVASLESLLTAVAIDRLDSYKRKSNFNQELFSKGSGNMVSSLLGGLPIIAEVVRSSANVGQGAKTSWSNFFHGLFLLIFIVFFSGVIHSIPLASLAAMLMVTGYRLAAPSSFMSAYRIGKEQFLIFTITVLATLLSDLLIGILAGILIKLIVHTINGVPLKSLFKPFFTVNNLHPDTFIVDVKHSAVFSNYLGLKRQLDSIPKGKDLVIDFSRTQLVDHHVMEQLEDFSKEYIDEGGSFKITGLHFHKPLGKHPHATRKFHDHDLPV